MHKLKTLLTRDKIVSMIWKDTIIFDGYAIVQKLWLTQVTQKL